jgi:hypothetical protein
MIAKMQKYDRLTQFPYWRWWLYHENGSKIAMSVTYSRKSNARRGFKRFLDRARYHITLEE